MIIALIVVFEKQEMTKAPPLAGNGAFCYSFICRTASVVRIFFSMALGGRIFSTSV